MPKKQLELFVKNESKKGVKMSEISYKQEVFRKLIHLSSLWMVCAIILLQNYRMELGLFFAICCILNVIVERMVVLQVPIITPLYGFFFKNMLRSNASSAKWVISGSPPVWAAAVPRKFPRNPRRWKSLCSAPAGRFLLRSYGFSFAW